MRILLINGNTSPATTEKVAAEARRVAGPDIEITAATAEFGAGLIRTRADNVLAAHAVLAALARHHRGCDAAVLAVSTDTGLSALREIAPFPVVGMTEAALLTACLMGGKFGMIVFDRRAEAVFREVVEGHGFAGRMAGLRTLEMTVAEFQDPALVAERTLAAAKSLVRETAADSVIVTGGTMAGVAHKLQKDVPVPLIDGISCAVLSAASLVRLALPKPRAGSFVPEPFQKPKGVDPALVDLLGAIT
ncbi:MAG: aspartate/glutamate racemase family protein [Parvibaculaceae bacterium]